MQVSAKTVRNQISKLQPFLGGCSLETIRKGQNLIGELMTFHHRNHVLIHDHPFDKFEAAWVLPKDERRQGVGFLDEGPRSGNADAVAVRAVRGELHARRYAVRAAARRKRERREEEKKSEEKRGYPLFCSFHVYRSFVL